MKGVMGMKGMKGMTGMRELQEPKSSGPLTGRRGIEALMC